MPKEHLIIVDNKKTFEDGWRIAAYKLYESDERLRTKADEIHHSRLMEGKACFQCIEMAIHQLGWKIIVTLEVDKNA